MAGSTRRHEPSTDLSVSSQRRRAYIRGLLEADVRPPAPIVEFGAAPGDQISELAHAGYRATALDIDVASDGWSDGEEGRMRQLLDAAGVELVVWNLEKVPYPLDDESFDAVIMTEVFEHLRDYPLRSLVEARRVLRPGGRLYFTTPNAAYLMTRLRLLTGSSVGSPLSDWIGGVPHARHAREYTFSEVLEILELARLRAVRVESRHFFVEFGSFGQRTAKWCIDRVARVRPTLGPTIVVVAER